MKVLIITNAFPNSAEETRGIFTYQIAEALQEKCDVEVIAPLPWVPSFLRNMAISRYPHANVPHKENIGNITVHHPRYLVIPKIFSFLHSVFLYFPLAKLVRRLAQNDKIDLINAHWIFPDGVATTLIAKRIQKPVVLTALGCDINLYPKMSFRKSQIRWALKASDRNTAKSRALKAIIVNLGIPDDNVTVIPNAVDLDLFHIIDKAEARKKLMLSPNEDIILTVGDLDEVKGTQYLIEALRGMRERTDLLPRLICIGDGPLKRKLVFQAKELGVSDKVSFLGNKPHDEIPLWMNAADVFCLPSLREGHPNVIIEALVCGVPVVASDVGAIPEMINGNGIMSMVADSKNLCECLMWSLTKNWDRDAIRKTVEKRTWRDCAQVYFETYARVLEENRFCSA
jgi:teichuronic acid biosynthesis glycosyltransferase TuaC